MSDTDGSADILADIRLSDLVTFLAVRRASSIHAAVRAMRTGAPQVSKALARLESLLGEKLVTRGHGESL